MKPSIGKKVYLIGDSNISDYARSICLENVGYVGKESFVIEGYNVMRDGFQEYYYKDYGKTWFTSLSDVTKFLIAYYAERGEKILIVGDTDYWEVRFYGGEYV
jgi:hypothetical protein